MKFVYLGFEVIATFFESFIIMNTISNLFQQRKADKNKAVSAIILPILIGSITVLCNFFGPKYKDIADLGIVAIYIFICLFFYEGNLFFKIIIPVILTIIIIITNMLVNIFMSQIYGVSSEYLIRPGSNLRILGLFMTKISFFLITRIMIKKIKKQDHILKTDEWLGMTVIFLISAGILFTMSEIQYKHIDRDLNMLLLIIGVLIIDIFVFFFFNKITKKNKELTLLQISHMRFDENLKALQSIESIYNEMNILKHDMKNEWFVIYDALQKGDNMRAKNLLKNMIAKTDGIFTRTVAISQPSINSIVNYKINFAKQNGIYCTSMMQDDFTSFDEYDLVMLIANLLDNAIEASKNTEDPRIDITIATKKKLS